MALQFDPTRTYTDFDPHIAKAVSPRQRRMLSIVRDHAKAEVDRSLDRLMATLVPDPAYHFWVMGKDLGPKGYEGVRSYYLDYVASGGAVLESTIERLTVDDGTVVQDGCIRNLIPAGVARRRGYAVPDDVAHVVVTFRSLVLWPFDDGDDDSCLLLGEDSYAPLDHDAWEPVAAPDLPSYYLDYLAEIGLGA